MVSPTRRRTKWYERPSGVVLVAMLVLSGGGFNPPPLTVAVATWLLVASYLVLLLVVLKKVIGASEPRWTRAFLSRALVAGAFTLGAPWIAGYVILVPGVLYHQAHPEAPWDDIANTYAFVIVPLLLYVPTFLIALAFSWEVANPPYRVATASPAEREASKGPGAPKDRV